MKRRLISTFLVLCMMVSLFAGLTISAGAADNALPETLWIAPSETNGVPSQITLCKPYAKKSGGGGIWGGGGGWPGWNPGGGQTTPTEEEEDTGYQLYLPGNVDSANCFLSWEGGLTASDGEKSYASGQLPVPKPGETKTYTFTLGEETKEFEVSAYQGSKAVKPIFIEIDETQGTIEAMNSDRDHETECTGIIYIDGVQYGLPKMKGRGNYSWSNAVNKRPYNITLDKKVNLLGINSDKTKKWSLLANVNDHTLLRNKVAYDLAYQMGIGLDSATADVWMNGEYQGTYLVTPKTDSFITDDGYLVENDNYREDSVESGGDPSFTVSGHKESDTAYATSGLLTTVKKIGKNLLEGGEETPEALTAAAVPIREYLQDAWDALGYKDGKNSKGKYYTDYFDFSKTACMYLFQEFVKNLEVDGGSIFFHRDGTTDADKLIPGPAWDYDNALGFNGTSFGGGDRLCVSGWFFKGNNSTSISFYGSSGGNLFTTVAKHDDIMEEAKRMYNIYYANFEAVSENVKAQADLIEDSALMNFVRDINETMNAYDMSSPKTTDKETKYETTYQATDEWRDYIDNLVLYTAGRAQFMSDELLDETPAAGFTGSFVLGKNSSVTVYPTQDTTAAGEKDPAVVLARNSATGEIDITGEGQINFVVDLKDGYQISNIKVEPAANYKNLKDPVETGIENGYRITKVTGPVTITVETQEFVCEHEFVDGKCVKCGQEAYRVDFDCENCSVTVYPTQDLTTGGQEKAAFGYAKSDVDGSISVQGDGQVNFVVVPDPGYEVDSVTAAPANYKNLKGPDETLSPNAYRVTKVTGPVTVTAKAVKTTCQHDYKAAVTAPTCEDKGYTTYTCSKCGDSYKDNEVAPLGHDMVDGKCTRCDMEAFTVTFACDHASVTVYHTQNLDGEKVENAKVGYARASETGDYDTTGDGQVNFVVIPDAGYELDTVTAEPKNYKNLKAPDETLVENGYRATKITGNFTVTVTTKKAAGGECEHEYTAKVTEPTCEAAGFTTYTCAKCGHSYTEPLSGGTMPEVVTEVNVPSGLTSKRAGMTYGKVYNLTYHSSVAGRDKKVNVQVPADYDESKSYPVLYLLHGIMGSENDMVGQGTLIQNLIADGLAEEMIIVCPNMFSGKSASPTGINQAACEGYDKFSDEIVTDLMPFIKENFSIKEGKANTALAGFSMGGRETLSISLFHPDVFGYICAISSAPGVIAGKDMFMTHPGQFTEDEVIYPEGQAPFIMMTSGDKDSVVGTFPQVYDELYTRNGIDHYWWVIPGADHGGATNSGIYNFAKYVFKTAGASGPLGHDYKAVTTEPTCTEKGYTTHTCTRCGDTYEDNETAALGHDWDDGVEIMEPTLTGNGIRLYTCKRCGATREEKIIKPHEHAYEAEVIKPTCTQEGYTIYTCECGETYTADKIPALGHDWDAGKVTVEPTETTKGTKVFTCKRCGETKTESIPEKGHIHQYTKSVTEPTCVTAGYTTYICNCGDKYVSDEVPALGHDYKVEVIAPTCLENGYTEHTCSRCGEVFIDNIVRTNGHTYQDGKCVRCGAADPDWVGPKPCPSEKYLDAPAKGNWAHEGIDYCIDAGYMNGMNETTFKPQGTVTRAQLVTILYRVATEPPVEYKGTFEDVKPGKFYSNAVEWAAAQGVVTGKSATKFAPDEAITREQIAAILYRYKGSPEIEVNLDVFPDNADASNYARKALTWAVREGLINGIKTDGVIYLSPKTSATRAQIAAIIMRFMEGTYTCGE